MLKPIYAMVFTVMAILRMLIGFVLLNPITILCTIMDRSLVGVLVTTGEYDLEEAESAVKKLLKY